jgi:hypothetical protein
MGGSSASSYVICPCQSWQLCSHSRDEDGSHCLALLIETGEATRTVQRSHVQPLSGCCVPNSTRHSFDIHKLCSCWSRHAKGEGWRNRRRTAACTSSAHLQLDQWDRPQREAYGLFRPRDGVRCVRGLATRRVLTLPTHLARCAWRMRIQLMQPTSVYSASNALRVASSLKLLTQAQHMLLECFPCTTTIPAHSDQSRFSHPSAVR